MGINLEKGQRISLEKAAPGLKNLLCGLGWDVAQSDGLLGFLKLGPNLDLDASIICLDSQDKLKGITDLVYFGNLRHSSGAVTHLGDNLTGEGEGDDEQILVALDQLPPAIQKLVFVVNIYECLSRKQDFSQVKNAFVRLIDRSNNQEIARYNLSGSNYAGMTGMIMAEVYLQDGQWQMAAKGEGFRAKNLQEITQRYR
ncbi:TerD family protein [Roseofilum sp. BLCC_M154]|uniref:TerD family protein n=1 Tax=Roseofilum acuticapitatum BLCC-M154 TaxID=3022444 RepID=A0ABT7AM55_9CYAN|nr:TerD family protein [Roseofilum acuticapitatum]MDJ1167980.1 TerD family protein [Roseofilum acuticapitatum BLCC-M154]